MCIERDENLFSDQIPPQRMETLLEEAFNKRVVEYKEEGGLPIAENIDFEMSLDGQGIRDLLEESIERFTLSKEEDVWNGKIRRGYRKTY